MRMEQVIILIEQRMERIGHKDAKFSVNITNRTSLSLIK